MTTLPNRPDLVSGIEQLKQARDVYESVRLDIVDAWENPIDKHTNPKNRSMLRITRQWIYQVDPETMAFVKMLLDFMPGHYSLYKTFTAIMECNTIEKLIKKFK